MGSIRGFEYGTQELRKGKKKNIAQRRRGAEKNSKEKAVKAEDNQACGYKRGRLTK